MQNIQIHTCLFSIGFTFNLVYVKIPHIFLADELLVNVVYVFRCNDLMGNSLKRTSRHSRPLVPVLRAAPVQSVGTSLAHSAALAQRSSITTASIVDEFSL